MTIATRRKELLGDGLILVIGLIVCLQVRHLAFGTLNRMGPGFFPFSLGIILLILGSAICLKGLKAQEDDLPKAHAIDLRGTICIVASLILFILLGNHFGLIPAIFITVVVAAYGDRRTHLIEALGLAVASTTVGIAVFWWALQIQIPLFDWN